MPVMATVLQSSNPFSKPRKGRPRLRPFRSREALMAAARELFNQQPWQVVSMNDIAAQAGLTRRTLYNQFATAEELFRATRDDLILDVAKIIPLSVPGGFRPQAAFRTYFRQLAEAISSDSYQELLNSIVRDGWSAPWFLEAFNRHIRLPIARSIELYIQEIQPNGSTSSSDNRREALHLLAAIEAVALASQSLSSFYRVAPEVTRSMSDIVDGFLNRIARPSDLPTS